MTKVVKTEVIKHSEEIVKDAVNKAIRETKKKEEGEKRSKKVSSIEHQGYLREKKE